jgi:hypothetical protein
MALTNFLRLPQTCRPSLASINRAAQHGLTINLFTLFEQFPDALPDAATISSLYALGHTGIINLFYTAVPGFTTLQSELNSAALAGKTSVLNYCNLKTLTLIPDLTTIVHAKMAGHSNVED